MSPCHGARKPNSDYGALDRLPDWDGPTSALTKCTNCGSVEVINFNKTWLTHGREHTFPACNGTGFSIGDAAVQPGRNFYPSVQACAGKGKIRTGAD